MIAKKKIFIIIPAYNVEMFIDSVINRIPGAIWHKVDRVVIINDGSKDRTLRISKKLAIINKKIKVINKVKNEGYAKAQKTGFEYCLANGADIVVLLHGDGQYAPEVMGKLLEPLINNKADIVQGSRILAGNALKGNMPLYKYVANRFLSIIENWVYGMHLMEYHSGYMLYSRKALTTIPFQKLSNTFHFDGEMLLVGNKKSLVIKQIPIPTHYGDEKSNLKPIQYGIDVLKIMIDYKRGKYDF